MKFFTKLSNIFNSMHLKNCKNSAFSLVEIAIVILVIGVLALVVSGGDSLIQQSKIRKTINEINTILSSYRNFESTYDAVAGDMVNAYDYFSTDCATASGICNGDGDGYIEGIATATDEAEANDDLEYLRFFQHLKLAELLEGNYVGTGVESTDYTTACDSADIISATCVTQPKYNVPPTVLSPDAYYIVNHNTAQNVNQISLGKTDPSLPANLNVYPTLSASDAKSIDLKLDDGFASQGKVISLGNQGSANCRSGIQYNASASGTNCYLKYLIR